MKQKSNGSKEGDVAEVRSTFVRPTDFNPETTPSFRCV